MVDSIKVAQLIYLLLNNEEVRLDRLMEVLDAEIVRPAQAMFVNLLARKAEPATDQRYLEN